MTTKLHELLETFRQRAIDPALVGHMCHTQEAFQLAATELELAIAEAEPPDLIAYIPTECITLVHAALHFRVDDDDCWETLVNAALDVQTGPS